MTMSTSTGGRPSERRRTPGSQASRSETPVTGGLGALGSGSNVYTATSSQVPVVDDGDGELPNARKNPRRQELHPPGMSFFLRYYHLNDYLVIFFEREFFLQVRDDDVINKLSAQMALLQDEIAKKTSPQMNCKKWYRECANRRHVPSSEPPPYGIAATVLIRAPSARS